MKNLRNKHYIWLVCSSLVLGFSMSSYAMKKKKPPYKAAPKGSTPQSMKHNQATKNTWYDDRIRKHGVIYFFSTTQPYKEFTNFYEPATPISIDSYQGNPLTWRTTEQYYQAGKFTANNIKGLIRTGTNQNWPHKSKGKNETWGRFAFRIGRDLGNIKIKVKGIDKFKYKMPDWNQEITVDGKKMQLNEAIMLKALREKFDQDANLRGILLRTYPKILVEDSNKDGYFGAGDPNNSDNSKQVEQGKGRNLLGRMLMHVRKEMIRKHKQGKTNWKVPFDPKTFYTLDYLLKGGSI